MTKSNLMKYHFSHRDQLRTGTFFFLNNIAESLSKYSNKDFIRFLIIATVSCTEVSSISYFIGDHGHLNEEASIGLFNLYNLVQSKIFGFARSFKKEAVQKLNTGQITRIYLNPQDPIQFQRISDKEYSRKY